MWYWVCWKSRGPSNLSIKMSKPCIFHMKYKILSDSPLMANHDSMMAYFIANVADCRKQIVIYEVRKATAGRNNKLHMV